jgi:hypothetical protein
MTPHLQCDTAWDSGVEETMIGRIVRVCCDAVNPLTAEGTDASATLTIQRIQLTCRVPAAGILLRDRLKSSLRGGR